MIIVRNLRLDSENDEKTLIKKAAKLLRLREKDLTDFRIVKKSLDARKKNDIHWTYSVAFSADNEDRIIKRANDKNVAAYEDYEYPIPQCAPSDERPVIVGFGPAGMFAALLLSYAGARPIVIERGSEVGRRLMLVEAFRAEGLGVGLYYSLIDWHHPDFTVDCTHPLRPKDQKTWSKETFAKLNEGKDWNRYRKYMWEQIDELLTDYGKIDILWFDFSFSRYFTGKGRADWDSEGILTLVRKLQPGIIVNCRLDLLDDPCGYDFLTPEQVNLGAAPVMNGKKVAWETCQTLSGSWGYFRDEHTWKSSTQIIGQLSRTVALGGNLIMNVGPTGCGEFDARALERLDAYAKWMNANGEAVYGCTAAPSEFETPQGTALTWNPTTRRLYIHILEWPTRTLPLRFWNRIAYAQFLHDASEVKVAAPNWIRSMNGDDRASVTGMLQLPVLKPDVEVPVVEGLLKDGDVRAEEVKESVKLVP